MKGKQLLTRLKQVFPPLQSKSQKGQGGRIGIIGGSYQFSGAPFYTAMSSLKVGGDLAHIFCSKSSSSAIKSYSPQVIVHPVFESAEQFTCKQEDLQSMVDSWVQKIFKWQKAVYTWVIGPGLGRDKYMYHFFPKLIRRIPAKSVVVIDADGIYYLCQHAYLFKELSKFKAIITPNKKQLAMIEQTLNIDITPIIEKLQAKQSDVQEIKTDLKLENFTLLIKGQNDIIVGPKNSFIVSHQGGPKRCAGIGDILAGTVATCAYWDNDFGPALASLIVRLSTHRAFQKQGRGLTAPSIMNQLTETVNLLQNKLPLL